MPPQGRAGSPCVVAHDEGEYDGIDSEAEGDADSGDGNAGDVGDEAGAGDEQIAGRLREAEEETGRDAVPIEERRDPPRTPHAARHLAA